MNDKLNFAIENAEVIEENPDSHSALLTLDFFASGDNGHHLYVSEETLMATANTIKNCPLIWKYDEYLDDAYTHDVEEVPCGFVPEKYPIKSRKLPDGRTMLSVTAYVWRKYTGRLLEIFKRDGGEKPVSVEIVVNSMKRNKENGVMELLDFEYEGITVLGTYVTPAIPGAKATIVSFAEIKEAYEKDFAMEQDITEETESPMTKKQNDLEVLEQGETFAEDTSEETPTEDMGCGGNDKENMADQQVAEEETEDMASDEENTEDMASDEEDAEDSEEMSSDESEDESEDEGDKGFAYPEDFDTEKVFALCNDGEEILPDELLVKMFSMLEASIASNEELKSEVEGLKTFKADREAEAKQTIVNQTIAELKTKVQVPEASMDEMLSEAENYSLENIDAWKQYCKAQALDFAVKFESGEEVVVVGLPTSTRKADKRKDDLWS